MSGPAESAQLSEIVGFFVADARRSLILTVDKVGEVWLRNASNNGFRKLFSLGVSPGAVALDSEHRLLAVGGSSGVTIVSAVTGETRGTLKKLKTRAASLQFQPKGRALLIGGMDGEVYRWKYASPDPDAEKSLERYFGHSNVVSSVTFHPLGRVFFTGDWSGALNAWLPYDADQFAGIYDENLFGLRAFSDEATRTRGPRASASSIEHLAVSGDGETLMVGAQDGSLEWWGVRGFKMHTSVAAHKGLMYALAVAPSGTRVASAGRDGKLNVWRLRENVQAAAGTKSYVIELERALEGATARKSLFISDDVLVVSSSDGKLVEIRLS